MKNRVILYYRVLRFSVVVLALGLAGLTTGLGAEALPRVLLIGDSISGGYKNGVISTLAADAEVIHIGDNGEHTGTGLLRLDYWLGDEPWDLIHFNWGLWDLAYRSPDSTNFGGLDKINGTLTTTLEQYDLNLRELVTRLQATGATLLWTSTTPVPPGEPGRIEDDDLNYNAVATQIMREFGVGIDDLNADCRKRGKPQSNNVHDVGQLAPKVSTSILAALENPRKRAVLIDWSQSGDNYLNPIDGVYWNELHDSTAEDGTTGVFSGLVDSANTPVGWQVHVDFNGGSGFTGSVLDGFVADDPFDQADVTDDGIYHNAGASPTVITFSSLAATTVYQFETIGGRRTGGADGTVTVLTGTGTGGALLDDGTVLGFTVTSDGSGAIALGFEGSAAGATLNAFSIDLPPQILSTTPADDASGVVVSSALVATFDEDIALTGSGSITLSNLGAGPDVAMALPDDRVTTEGRKLTVDLTEDLSTSSSYAVHISADALRDTAAIPASFVGIADNSTWNFDTASDGSRPLILSTSPVDGTTNVAPSGELVATFSEPIIEGSGTIVIKDLTNLSDAIIPVGDPRIAVSGNTLTISPTDPLYRSADYAVHIDAGVVTDATGNPFAGIADNTTWNFLTQLDEDRPAIVSLSPTNNAVDRSASTAFVATFDEPIRAGTGNMTIRNLSALTEVVVPVGDPRIVISGSGLTLTPTALLELGASYAVRIDAGAVTDFSGIRNPFAGIDDDVTWTFDVAATPPDAVVLIDWSRAAVVSSPAADLKHWNSLGATGQGMDMPATPLVSTYGTALSWQVSVAHGGGTGFGGTAIDGPAGSDPFEEANAIKDGIFSAGGSDGICTITFSGVNPNAPYGFSAIGGRDSVGRDGIITVTTGTGTGGALLNDGTVLDFNVISDASGVIGFTYQADERSGTFNALRMQGASAEDTEAPQIGALGTLIYGR